MSDAPEWATQATRVVLDTNVFVAAGFNPRSASARILRDVRRGALRMVWNETTRRETQYILEKIPPLSWADAADLFREDDRFDGETNPGRFTHIADPDDRKFAALSAASGALLVSNDDHLLRHREAASVGILTSGDFWRRYADVRAPDL